MDSADQVFAVTGGVVLVGVAIGYLATRIARKAEVAERKRLEEEVLGHTSSGQSSSPPSRPADVDRLDHAAGPFEGDLGSAPITEPTKSRDFGPRDVGFDATWPRWNDDAERDRIYDRLLIQGYALGLSQARWAFNISITFSALGGLVLVLGVSMAIFQADSGGQVSGAAITSAAGVLTSGLSQIFRWQSGKSLERLARQSAELRKDVREQGKASTAQSLLRSVTDPNLSDRLHAALILRFTDAELPPAG